MIAKSEPTRPAPSIVTLRDIKKLIGKNKFNTRQKWRLETGYWLTVVRKMPEYFVLHIKTRTTRREQHI
jgi:hypothetical protein